VHAGRCAIGGTGVGGGDIGGLPPVDEPVVEGSTVDVNQVRTRDVGAGERPNKLGSKQ
jgi:hypothetical protein